MATLADKIKAAKGTYKGPGGVLGETSQEELQQLSGKAGLQAPPTTAIGAAMLGASPDQQKMAGSPAQMQNALRLSQELQGQTLETIQRRHQGRTEVTAQEAAARGKAEGLQGLSDVGTRVSGLIQAEKDKLVATQVQQQIPQTAAAATSTVADLRILQSNPQDMAAIQRVNQALGRDAGSLLTPDEIKGLYESQIDAVVRTGAEAVRNNLTVQDLTTLPAFGYDLPTLGNLLGIDPTTLGQYSITDLQAAVKAVGDQYLSETANLEAQAGSQALGGAERDLARGAAREASTTGLRATEADFQRLQDSIASAGVVQFGGQSYRVEDLLGSDRISQVISDYLKAPEGSSTRLQLDQTEPALVNWITENQKALGEAASQLTKGVEQFSTIQKTNEAVGNYGRTQLAPEVPGSLIPGYGTGLQSQYLETSTVPMVQYLNSLRTDHAETAVDLVNLLSKEFPEELASLSRDDLSRLQLHRGVDSPAIQTLRKAQEASAQVANLSPDDTDTIVNLFTGGEFQTESDLQQGLDDYAAAAVLGLGSYGTAGGFDQDRDHRPDTGRFLDTIKSSVPTQSSLKDILEGKTVTEIPSVRFERFSTETLSPTQQRVFTSLRDAALDGEITGQEILDSDLVRDEELLREMKDSGLAKKLGAEAEGGIMAALSSHIMERTRAVEEQYPLYDMTAELEALGGRKQLLEDTDTTTNSLGYTYQVPKAENIDKLTSLRDTIEARSRDVRRAYQDADPSRVYVTELQKREQGLDSQWKSIDKLITKMESIEKKSLAAAIKASKESAKKSKIPKDDIFREPAQPEPEKGILEEPVEKLSGFFKDPVGTTKAEAGRWAKQGKKLLGGKYGG